VKLTIFYTLLIAGTFSISLASAQDTSGLSVHHKKFERMMKKKNTVMVDVRTAEEYKSGYIGNAVNYNVMDSLAFLNTISTLDTDKKFLLYCKSGRRSGKALVMMKDMGFKKVHHLKGGITEWKGELKKPD
jgi:rhodanese-related sulfurtransferase